VSWGKSSAYRPLCNVGAAKSSNLRGDLGWQPQSPWDAFWDPLDITNDLSNKSSPTSKASGNQVQLVPGVICSFQRWTGIYPHLLWPHQLIWELSLSRQIVLPSWITCWPPWLPFHYPLLVKDHEAVMSEVAFTHPSSPLLYVLRDGRFFQLRWSTILKDFKINLILKVKKINRTEIWIAAQICDPALLNNN